VPGASPGYATREVEHARLIELVRAGAGLESEAEAEAGLEITLERLGEWLEPAAADALASRLPAPAAAALRRRRDRAAPPGGAATLAEEVAAAAVVAPAEGARLVRATLDALAAAITPERLPPELLALRGADPPQPARSR